MYAKWINWIGLAIAILIAPLIFKRNAQAYPSDSLSELSIPQEFASIPDVTPDWWASAQTQLDQDLAGMLAPIALNATPDWVAYGEGAMNNFAYSLASAGDVNGDGYADLVAGAFGYGVYRGKVVVFHGSASGLSLTPNWSAVGEDIFNYFGSATASAGDVNGDGYSDLAIGAYGYDSQFGKVYVYLGSANGLSTTADWSLVGPNESGAWGQSIGSAGDVNGDGYSDLAIGDSSDNTATGKVYVYFGSANGLNTTEDWSVTGESPYEYFGSKVSSAGDVNGDGNTDLAVGAIGYNGLTGKVSVFHGSANGLSTTPNWYVIGEILYMRFGEALASGGDVNGDGFDDFVIGAYWYDNFRGKTYVYYGSVNGLSLTPDWNAIGEFEEDTFGISVSSAGDVNGDSYSDLVIGALGYNSTINDRGKAYVYFGSSGGLSNSADWSVVGEKFRDCLGASVSSAGDVNNDGFSDLAVGAHCYRGFLGKGMVFLGSAGCTVNCLRVTAIEMQADAKAVYAQVTILDENGVAIPNAVVSVFWDLPLGSVPQTKITDASGVAAFRATGEAGMYTINLANVTWADYTFDLVNSEILSKSIMK